MNPPIDVVFVSGRRPDLLAETLSSFQDQLFRHFEIANFRVNLDPFGGDEAEHRECLRLIRERYPAAIVNEPKEAGFGEAVRHLWSTITSPYAVHLEDDWVAHEDITPEKIFPLFEGRTRQVTFLNKHKRRKGSALFDCKRTRSLLSPMKTYDPKKPLFTTSPGFIDSSFARISAELLDPKLDPEKQFYNGFNAELEHFASIYRNRFLIGEKNENIISDIGRDWREVRGLTKQTIDGVSTWENQEG